MRAADQADAELDSERVEARGAYGMTLAHASLCGIAFAFGVFIGENAVAYARLRGWL